MHRRSPPRASAPLLLRDGAWLGVDVGQRSSKVYAFCLVEARAGIATVSFERGAWRPLLEGTVWPRGDAGVFEDLARPSRLSEAAERCALAILDGAELVARWRGLAREPSLASAACVDAPAGFARAGRRQRETERCAAGCYPTESEEDFLSAMRRFSAARNDTPLRQRYYWKLVGRIALAHAAAEGGGARPGERELAAVAARSAAHGDHPATGGVAGSEARALRLPRPPAGLVRVREGFPSDTYARANGRAGVLAPAARALLGALVAASWRPAGNVRRGRSSAPPPAWMGALHRQQAALAAEVAAEGPMPSMIKIPGDPPWADLWDAFSCAFAACCEAHGCGVLLGGDASLLRAEGAIVAPRMR